MNYLLTILGIAVYAAEVIITPLPSSPISDTDITAPAPTPTYIINITQSNPNKSFADMVTKNTASTSSVLGESTSETDSNEIKENAVENNQLQPQQKPRKNSYTIALLGDSMIDTLGPGVPDLYNLLKDLYPDISFNILNYGVGATNIEYGIDRITNNYDYLNQEIPPLSSTNPDIVVIESFAYNPFPQDVGALDRHWLALAGAVDTVKDSLPYAKILIASTIAPNADSFCDGAPGLSFDSESKKRQVENIKSYLNNAVAFAVSEEFPIADAFHTSLLPDGNGNKKYINPGDNIHYSDNGRKFFTGIITEAIEKYRLLE